jgi:mono/diheme cytochrome c family protein
MEGKGAWELSRLVRVLASSTLLILAVLTVCWFIVIYYEPKCGAKCGGCVVYYPEKYEPKRYLKFGDASHGKELFDNNCASCHNIHKVMVGPALKGILERRKMNWIIKWVRNPAQMVASKDPYAMKLVAEYQSAGIMTSFKALKKKDIEDIMAYVGSY